MQVISEEVEFRGHPMIRATHPTTIEVTRDDQLTPRGDCIVGVSSSKGVAGISEEVRRRIAVDGAELVITIEAGGERFSLRAKGDSRLTLLSERDMVIRRSGFICDRTLAVSAEGAAREIPRTMVESLRSSGSRGTLRIEVRDR